MFKNLYGCLFVAFAGIAGSAQAIDDYVLGPDSAVREGVPKGKIEKFTHKSDVFPGTEREVILYIPAQYDGTTPIASMVFQDGAAYAGEKGQFRTTIVFDNLIHEKKIPVMAGIFINPGMIKATKPGGKDVSNRSFEYDTRSAQYATFLEKEIFPEVQKRVKLKTDAASRGICGISSGGICAFTAAWERPDMFSKVLSHIGSFTNIRGGDAYPGIIRKTPKKPIRIFMQEGSNDLDNEHGNWPLANRTMDAALRFKKYDAKYVEGDGQHNGKHGGAILPESLIWLWRE